MGRTSIVLDDGLIKRAMRVSGAKTRQQAVDRALRELVARASVYQALKMLKGRMGRMPWDVDGETRRRQRQ
jgi:Arc/MetJ family transcription regulator